MSEKISERKDSNGKEEPWYLLTNDFTTDKEAVIARYYFRFEIEEAFKDLKHVSDLANFFRIKTAQTFQIILWFPILSIWLAFLLAGTKQYLSDRIGKKRRKKLSVVRFFAEMIQLEVFTYYKQQFL